MVHAVIAHARAGRHPRADEQSSRRRSRSSASCWRRRRRRTASRGSSSTAPYATSTSSTAIGLPIWARFVRAQGATKGEVGKLDVPVVVGGAEIRPGDLVVMDCDGAMALPRERVDEVLPLALERAERERAHAGAVRRGRAFLRPAGAPQARGGLMEVAVLGLGEAGGRIAADLVAAGCTVRGWDPARRPAGIANAAQRPARRSAARTSSSASTRRRSRSRRQSGSPTSSAPTRSTPI